MRTIPAALIPLLNRRAYNSDWLLKIEADSGDLYFAGIDRWIEDSDGGTNRFYRGLIKDIGKIKQKSDPQTGKWSTGNLSITLENTPYRVDPTDGWTRLSDELTAAEIVNRDATVYLFLPEAEYLTSALVMFSGIINPADSINKNELNFDIVDYSFERNKLIPPETVDLSTFSTAPKDSINIPIPLVYGAHDIEKDGGAPARGAMIQGVWISHNKVVLSDHVLDNVSSVWIFDPDLDELVSVDSGDYTVTLNDSGRTTVQFDNMNDPTLTAYLYPDNSDIVHANPFNLTMIDDERIWAYDKDQSTKLELIVDSYIPNGDMDNTYVDDFFGKLKSVTPVGELVTIELETNFTGNLNPTRQTNARVHFYHEADTQEVGDVPIEGTGAYPTYSSSPITTAFITTYGYTLQDLTSPNSIKIHHVAEYLSGTGGFYDLTYIYGLRLKITYKRSIQYWTSRALISKPLPVYCEGDGREFGSWIDGIGRTDNYDEGDVINNPAGIIESILRDELSYVTAEIDQDSFDAAMTALGANWNMTIQLQERLSAKEVIEDICRQAKMIFFISADGTAKISTVDNTTSDDTLSLDDIEDFDFEYSQGDIKKLWTSVEVQYSPSRLDGKFQEFETATNSTAETTYRTAKHKVLKAPYIDDQTAAQSLRDHYSGASGHWKDLRPVLTVRTVRYNKIEWELGDVITPDADIGSLVNYLGVAWGSAKFVIVEKTISKTSGLEFKMIESN